MKKIEAIIRTEKFEEFRGTLDKVPQISGLTITQGVGCGKQTKSSSFIRGQEVFTMLFPEVIMTTIVKEEDVDLVVDHIIKVCKTGNIGDGKIFISNIENIIRIRTGEHGANAV